MEYTNYVLKGGGWGDRQWETGIINLIPVYFTIKTDGYYKSNFLSFRMKLK